MIIHSEQEMVDFGKQFANKLLKQIADTKKSPSQHNSSTAIVLELIGDIGVGKTTFTRGLAEGLGIKEPITSPSFTISKQYALSNNGRLIHYDFYRLPDPGLMAEDLSDNLNNPDNIIIIEWGESISDLLPPNRHSIHFSYTNGGREVTI